MSDSTLATELEGIAVVGMAGRFPGARNVEEFWENLVQGVESITQFTDQELLASGVPAARLNDPNYVRAGTILSDIENFDAAFFGLSPREASIMDPQQRLMLECAWEALESAGYDPQAAPGSVGVFAGAGPSIYLLSNLMQNRECWETFGAHQIMLNNEKDHLAPRVSYKLNLRGPSLTVQTSCSSSLVAVHLGCQSLSNYECDMALAGGVSLAPQRMGYRYQEGGILAPDGHCRAFDAEAKGTVAGSGAGIVVLKRLAEAVADGDNIVAVIKGSAINNDGSAKVGYTAPGVQGQSEVIVAAAGIAGVSFDSIRYVEAHGTGTPVGDPIEVAALTKAFQTQTSRKGFCALGSVKTNIGHLNTAAGVAGLIKTILMLQHRQLPPSLHFHRPNPQIDFGNSPFYVNTALTPWEEDGGVRIAGVSSLGIGGTNAHVVVAEAPPRAPSTRGDSWLLFPISARTEAALDAATSRLAAHLRQHPELSPADVAYTLQVGRHPFATRRVLVGKNLEEVIEGLEAPDSDAVRTARNVPDQRPVLYLLPGQGARPLNKGREIYRQHPVFRGTVDHCAKLLEPQLGIDIRKLLYPERDCESWAQEQLKSTALVQPVLLVLEYALAQLWREWGVTPQALLGHSLGEYTAACLAGVFSLESALWLVSERGRLQQGTPLGAMTAVTLSEQEAQEWLADDVWLAAVNGPAHCTLSGTPEAVNRVEAALKERSIGCTRLATSHAFHSGMMDTILETFLACIRQVSLNSPQIPYICNVTGAWIQPEDATDAAYWARHMRQPVRFGQGLEQACKDLENPALLEVGPGGILSSLSSATAHQHGGIVVSSLPGTKSDAEERAEEVSPEQKRLMEAVGGLWLSGVRIDWNKFTAKNQNRRVSLPTYPFQRQRHWIDLPIKSDRAVTHTPSSHADRREDLAQWFYVPVWKQSRLLTGFRADCQESEFGVWIVFGDSVGFSAPLIRRLVRAGRCVVVSPGAGFQWMEAGRVTINPQSPNDYLRLVTELAERYGEPWRILHLWNVIPPQSALDEPSGQFALAQELGFYSLLYLAQALTRLRRKVSLSVVGNGLCDVSGAEELCPDKAPLLGLCTVIPQEQAEICCRCIDVGFSHEQQADWLMDQLLAETARESVGPLVAYRGRSRMELDYQSLPLDGRIPPVRALRPEGVYLITGGLGKVALALAEHLARSVRARLILVGRTEFPARGHWDAWLASHDAADPVSAKIRALLSFEEMGSVVSVATADVSDESQMKGVLADIDARFGALHGVFHAAGITGTAAQTPLDQIVAITAQQHFQPKVHGLYTLERVLKGRDLDFCVLFGSNAAVLGGFGRGAYAAANAFMNAFAADRSRNTSVPWININWDGWWVSATQGSGRLPEKIHDHSIITPAEGIAAIERILGDSPSGPIVVSATDLATRIRTWLYHEAPGKSIPTEPSDQAETKELDSREGLRNDYVAPRNAVEQTLAEVWQRLLGVATIGVDDNFFDLHGHSLLAVRMMAEIEKSFGRKLPLQVLFESATVAGLAEKLGTDPDITSRSGVRTVTPTVPNQERIPIFCVAAGDINALGYAALARCLGADQPLFVLQAHCSNYSEKPYMSDELKMIAAEMIRELRLLRPHGPYCLTGQCTGTYIAFEMARQLQAAGEEVPLLVSFDTWPEENTRTRIGWWLNGVRLRFKRAPSIGVVPLTVQIAGLTIRCVREWCLRPFRPPAPDSWEARYWPGPGFVPDRFKGKMTVIRVQKQKFRVQRHDLGWSDWVTEGVDVHEVPGDHSTMLRMPHAFEVAAILQRQLDLVMNVDKAGLIPASPRREGIVVRS